MNIERVMNISFDDLEKANIESAINVISGLSVSQIKGICMEEPALMQMVAATIDDTLNPAIKRT